MRYIVPMFAIALVVASPLCDAFSADKHGRYITGGGIGESSCTHFVSAMENAQRYRIQSPEYWNQINGYVAYVAGFQTAYNYVWLDRQDIFDRFKNIEEILFALENECRREPTNKFYSTLVTFANAQR